MKTNVLVMRIMYQNIIFGNSILTNLNNFQLMSTQYKSLVAVLAKNHWFAIFESNCPICSNLTIREFRMSPVVINNAICKHLHNSSTIVYCSSQHNALIQFQLRIENASKKCTPCPKHKLTWVKRMFYSSIR